MKVVRTKISLFLILVFAVLFSAKSQEESKKLSLENGTVAEQFDYVITKSNNYQDFKVIKKNWLYTLKKHTLDSLQNLQVVLTQKKEQIANQAKEIESLKNNLSETKTALDQTQLAKDNMSFLGISMSKTSYNITMWLIIIALIILLIFFFYKYKNSNVITRESKKAFLELEEEFNAHRQIALEREQKVRRQLQDEIIKNKKND